MHERAFEIFALALGVALPLMAVLIVVLILAFDL
jgi:hypothetical protein